MASSALPLFSKSPHRFAVCMTSIFLLSCRSVRSIQSSVQRRPFLHQIMASHASAAAASTTGSFDETPVTKRCKLIALADPADPANAPLLDRVDSIPHLDLLAVGVSVADFDLDYLRTQQANTIFVASSNAREPLAQLLQGLPSIEWIHSRSAGIDHITSPSLCSAATRLVMTNAKGLFSSTLAEYSLMACAYFAKDLPRILQQQRRKDWNKFPIRELRGSTMGIIGFGDIGAATARLAKAYGMRVLGLRNRRRATEHDSVRANLDLCDAVYYREEDADALRRLFAESDFIVCAAPLTEQTKGMIGKNAFDSAKSGAVFINVGRGQIVDEDAMIAALESRKLRGAGLDVVATEPLPPTSRLWELDNVLLSPHNMDMTETFMHESTEWFVTQNLPRFVRGMELENAVDPSAGY